MKNAEEYEKQPIQNESEVGHSPTWCRQLSKERWYQDITAVLMAT